MALASNTVSWLSANWHRSLKTGHILGLLSARRLAILTGFLVLGVVFSAILYKRFFSSAAITRAEAANTSNNVAALGRVEPYSEIINLGAGSSPDRLDVLFVQRGDLVKKNDVLGRLAGYEEQKAQRDMIAAQLDEAKTRLAAAIELDHARIQAAQIHQQQVIEVMPQRVAAQEATIASLQAKLNNDQEVLDSQQQLLSRGSASKRTADDQNSLVLQGRANLQSAIARLAELKQQFEVDKIDADVQIKTAQAQLARNQAEIPIASLERQIALADARIKRMTLFAPIDGRILNILVKLGENVGTGPILVMGDTSRMRAVAEVYETDISRVRLGQTATISSRALPKPITGKVGRIGEIIFKNDVLNVDPAARADARIVQVWIDLDDPKAVEGLTNLTVDVVIDIAKARTS